MRELRLLVPRPFADVVGRPLHIAPTEAGARGAVLAAVRRFDVYLDTGAWTRPVRVCEPDPARGSYHAEGYADYLGPVAAARRRWRSA